MAINIKPRQIKSQLEKIQSNHGNLEDNRLNKYPYFE